MKFPNTLHGACILLLLSIQQARGAESTLSPLSPLDLRSPAFTQEPPSELVRYLADENPTTAASTGQTEDAGELAKKLSNPVAALISVPLQSNFDFNAGQSHDRFRYVLNVQPVIPIALNDDWNLILRVIAPVVYQEELFTGQGTHFGLGDVNPTVFFSPRQTIGGWIIGAGPVFLLPTATNDAIGSGKWAAGPSVVVLQQNGPLTYGILANQLWSFAGDSDRPGINQTFLQPFFAYNSKTGFGLTIQTESTYSWEQHQWTIPIGVFASQVFKVGGQAMSISAGPRYYAEGPTGRAQWGFRFTLTLLFPQ